MGTGNYGDVRQNDIVPNGPYIPVANATLPNSLTLSTLITNASGVALASVLAVSCTSSFQVGTAGQPAAGCIFPANAVVYLPANGQDTFFFAGTGILSATIFTTRYNEA